MYHKIPIALLLGGCARGSREDVRVARRPLSERLQDAGCVEARFVALRLSGRISAEEMMNRLRGYGAQVCMFVCMCVCVDACVFGYSAPPVGRLMRTSQLYRSNELRIAFLWWVFPIPDGAENLSFKKKSQQHGRNTF